MRSYKAYFFSMQTDVIYLKLRDHVKDIIQVGSMIKIENFVHNLSGVDVLEIITDLKQGKNVKVLASLIVILVSDSFILFDIIFICNSYEDACEQPREEGPCQGQFRRWYFDKESNTCQLFAYGGCSGNNNNFPTESACKQQCQQPGRKKGKIVRTLSIQLINIF